MPCLKKITHTAAIFLLLSFSATGTRAQQGTNYSVQANIIYHFTKYIDWPADRKSGDFIMTLRSIPYPGDYGRGGWWPRMNTD